jgi:hypothetical protein
MARTNFLGRARVGVFAAVAAALAVPVAAAASASASAPRAGVPGAAVVVEPSGGSGKPTPGSGIGTQAALDNPRCTDPEDLAGFGRLDSFAEGAGPICVRPFEAGESNGGATSRGVTGDTITVVALAPTPGSMQATSSMNRTTGQPGTDYDALYDLLVPLSNYYETWGRDIEVKFIDSTGTDEAAQRADAVAALALEPFAVINLDTTGFDVFESEIAKADTLVFGYAANPNETTALAPYRWGGPDANVALLNAAEVVGKQLAGKKAEWAGEGVKGNARKFGLVSVEEIFDVATFKEVLDTHGGTLTEELTYPADGGPFGDTATSVAQAPSMVGRMKQSGVTTVILGTDVAMTKALMDEATKQEWFPEWFQTGFTYIDYQPFTKTYPAEQVEHMFGLALLTPYLDETVSDPLVKALSTVRAPLDWYWGLNRGTDTARNVAGINWLMLGIHAAGPKLTPKTFKQGLFSVPASGGSADGNPLTSMTGYGRTTGLPYDGYFASQLDYAPEWISVDTEAPLPVAGSSLPGPLKPSQMFVDGGTRYKSGDWPTKKIPFFNESKSVSHLETRPASSPAPVPTACAQCPGTTGSGNPGAPSTTSVTIPYVAKTSPSGG